MESNTVSEEDVLQQPPKHHHRRRVGILYDDRMCKHTTPNGEYHPENPNRVRSVWNKLQSSGITQRASFVVYGVDQDSSLCVILSAKEADDKNIALVHTKNHIKLIKNISSKKFDSQRNRIAANFNSIYFNEGSSEAAHLAAGSVVEVAEKVAKGELDSAFAIVRPPGHHAEENEPMGFCLYNNVAIAASYLLNERPDLGIKKILIVDWDVHHGNGTQKTFWKDPRVLFFSVHRHEFGTFYPFGEDGSHDKIGEGPGAGYNINVPWEHRLCGDADYIAVWDHILIPVAKEFDPDMIIISAGFDAAINDPLGGCCLSPYGYSVLLSKLMGFARGKIFMVLEGGYNLDSIANSALACVEVLLYEKPISGSCEDYPFESIWRVIQAVREKLSAFWPVLSEPLSEKVTSKRKAQILIPSSESEGEDDNGSHAVPPEDLGAAVENMIQPLQELKVTNDHDSLNVSPTWREELSKIDVWYATFGSNMCKSRFLCYIEGGQVEGMRRPCAGSIDKRPPKDSLWRIFPHRLFFGREQTATWGPGGVAFLHPESNDQDKAYLCLYKITLEQYNDVLRQENLSSTDINGPLFDTSHLQSIESKKCISLEPIKGGWDHNVLYLGKENDIPILTMTCTVADAENFKLGKFPICAPCKEYAATLIKGLVEGKQLSLEEATAYIEAAFTKPL